MVDVQNPTLIGTLLENRILCGTDIGQKGTHATLAYMYMLSMGAPPRFLSVLVLCRWSHVTRILIKVRPLSTDGAILILRPPYTTSGTVCHPDMIPDPSHQLELTLNLR